MPTGVYERTEEHKRIISQALMGNTHCVGRIPWDKGKTLSEEHKRKISESGKGRLSWNKGKKFSEESRKKMSEVRLKNPNRYWLGKKRSKKTIEKTRLANLGKHLTEETKRKISESKKGEKHHFYGKHFSKEYREKLSKAHIGIQARENNPNWQGGLSYEPYTPEFNRQLKELIRQRDGYKCQLCGMPEIENIKKLDIHHIDYNKKNCLPKNLISLCKKCHQKTNYNRDYWERYFNENEVNEENILIKLKEVNK